MMSTAEAYPFKVLPPPRRRPWLGLLLIALGYSHLITPCLVYLFWDSFRFVRGLLFFLLPAVAAHPLLLKLVRRGRALWQEDALTLLERDRRAPVLYLRSFEDDDLPDLTLPSNRLLPQPTFEGRLRAALAPLGPMVSIGRPGEKVPGGGSARLYVADNEWRSTVEFFMKRAAAVVVVVGRSDGVVWEALDALKQVPPERLLLCFPYVLEKSKRPLWLEYRRSRGFHHYNRETLWRADAERQSRYQIFRDGAGAALTGLLPPLLGPASFICFGEDGRPYFLKSSHPMRARLGALLNGSEALPVYLNFKKTLRPFVEERAKS